jgi:hypothetical protein
MATPNVGFNMGSPSVPAMNVGYAADSGMHWTIYLGVIAVLCLIGAIIYVFVYKPTLMPRMSWLSGKEGFVSGGAVTSKKLDDIFAVTKRDGTGAGSPRKEGFTEGFFGAVARGAGTPDCNRVLPDAAKVADALYDESDDARELYQLVGKLACFKKDLIGVAQQVEATRYQTFNTSHDLQPITETISMCFSKNIPKRDLTLVMDKYRSRGVVLINRLAASQNVPVATIKSFESAFMTSMTDVISLAEQGCLGQHENALTGGPAVSLLGVGRVEGVTSDDVSVLKPYDGYF